MVLAFLSLAGGILNIPHVFGGHESLHHFLSPVYAKATGLPELHLEHQTELFLMFGVMALIILMIFLAYRYYVIRKNIPVEEGKELPALQKVIYNKYYIDEIYDSSVVKTLISTSNFFFRSIENFLIDNFSVLTGRVAIGAGKQLRKIQTGKIGTYVFVFVVSVVVILLVNFYS